MPSINYFFSYFLPISSHNTKWEINVTLKISLLISHFIPWLEMGQNCNQNWEIKIIKLTNKINHIYLELTNKIIKKCLSL